MIDNLSAIMLFWEVNIQKYTTDWFFSDTGEINWDSKCKIQKNEWEICKKRIDLKGEDFEFS